MEETMRNIVLWVLIISLGISVLFAGINVTRSKTKSQYVGSILGLVAYSFLFVGVIKWIW
jgi:hypothetical protein